MLLDAELAVDKDDTLETELAVEMVDAVETLVTPDTEDGEDSVLADEADMLLTLDSVDDETEDWLLAVLIDETLLADDGVDRLLGETELTVERLLGETLDGELCVDRLDIELGVERLLSLGALTEDADDGVLSLDCVELLIEDSVESVETELSVDNVLEDLELLDAVLSVDAVLMLLAVLLDAVDDETLLSLVPLIDDRDETELTLDTLDGETLLTDETVDKLLIELGVEMEDGDWLDAVLTEETELAVEDDSVERLLSELAL